MSDILSIIDKILEEHKIILVDTVKLENITNDASALLNITKNKDTFMPGRQNQVQSLMIFEDLHNKIQTGLNNHFNREENGLLEAVLEYGNQQIIDSLKSLLSEHKHFRKSLAEIKSQANELMNGQLSRAMWETKAHEMRTHLMNMHRNLEHHAKNEVVLLNQLRKELNKTSD
jgi:hypothetical protein